jgi:transcriptional regulator with XRE-family HTH domain
MTLGERIKILRKKRGLTQEELAKGLFVTFQAVSKWECNLSHPDITLVAPLTKILNVSADELLGLNDFEENNTDK